MSMLVKWNPFRELDELQNRFGSFFGTFPKRMGSGNGGELTIPDWSPMVDITEDDNEYLVKADLPEMKKEDVKIVIDSGVLTISGERKSEKEEKKKKFHRIERSYGSFERTFTVPEDADPTKITAEFKDGVLRVHLRKNPAALPRKIDVKVD
jgi:HSP20 family protein